MKVRVSNIQRFSLHDGPGIRTTIFLKGCNLNCPWCANPENKSYNFTEYYNQNTKEKGIFGKDYTCDELFNEIMKDYDYYTLDNGGVTFSGGEPLLQIKAMLPLLKKLKEKKINICFETALQVQTELIQEAVDYVNEWIIDMKILDADECKNILNGDIELYFKNLDFLKYKNITIDIFRIPFSNEYTLKDNNIELLIKALKKYNYKNVEIFKIHNLALSKYQSIGIEPEELTEVSDEMLEKVYKIFKISGINVKIINI